MPDPAQQKEAEKTIKDLFKSDYAKKAPADRLALGRKFLEQARDTQGYLAAQWIFFREAQDIALQLVDFELLTAAMEGAARVFDIPVLPTRLAVLAAAAKNCRTPEDIGTLVDQFLKVLDGELEADDFEGAEKALAGAQQAARRVPAPALAARTAARAKELSDLKARFEKVRKATDVLAKDPKNGPANLEVGLYRCFVKKSWELGLPFLAGASDPGLSAAAVRDLAHPSDPERQVEAGDGWWDQGDKEKNEATRRQLYLRAVQWYVQALPSISGLAKTKVTTRLETQKKRDLTLGLSALFGDTSTSPPLVPCDADDGHFERAAVGGKSCVRLTEATIAHSDGTRYLYVHIAEKWQESWKPVEIEVEYFDEGSGNIELQYDGVPGVYKPAPKSFVLGGSKAWKTFVFAVPDPLFANRLKGGSDFRIHVYPGSGFPVHRMVVRLAQK